jgi:hypothetical protein
MRENRKECSEKEGKCLIMGNLSSECIVQGGEIYSNGVDERKCIEDKG